MKFSTQQGNPAKIKASAIVIGVYSDLSFTATTQELDKATKGNIKKIIKQDFKGKSGDILVLRQLDGIAAPRVMLVGLGEKSECSLRSLQTAAKIASDEANKLELTDLCISLLDALPSQKQQAARIIATTINESSYRYTTTFGDEKHKKTSALANIIFTTTKEDDAEISLGIAQGLAIGNGANLAKELGNLPGNYSTPTHLANVAKAIAKEHKLKVEVLDKKQIEALKMGSFLSVAKGSDEAPKFIVLHYEGQKKQSKKAKGPIVLVGKGLTFDSGGISIKPAALMDEMKYDMCGGATVLGTIKAVAEMGLPIHVIGVIPSCENMPNGRANKPGDVVTSMSGQTIEINNTDAEGRLILCDALTYVERFKPSAVIDIATLTGACITALGAVNSGLFSTDDDLANRLLNASAQALDPVWRMPVGGDYHLQLKSTVADMLNSPGPMGGAVTAATFLSKFTKAYPWAHLDIAGTSWRSGKDKAATGRPVYLLSHYLLSLV